MESWKVNLISVWFGCFFTGLAISQILPFLPLYVSQLGVTSHEALSMWSGLTFSVTFLVSAIVSPMWGSLADRKGRKLMLLRASLGMAIVIALIGAETAYEAVHHHWSGRHDISAQHLYLCSGYYDYDRGHDPQIPGIDDFAGEVLVAGDDVGDVGLAGARVGLGDHSDGVVRELA